MSEIKDKNSVKKKLTKRFLAISAITVVILAIITLVAVLIKGPFKDFWMQAMPWVASGLVLVLFIGFVRMRQMI